MSAADETADRYREPPECGVCDGIGGQRDMLTGDWLECWRCEGLGVLPRQEPVKSAEPFAEMVDCPACVRGEGCEDCDWTGRMTADRAAEWVRNNREMAEADADDRAHAAREGMQERG